MESRLHQVLKSLCVDTEWKYAVFWKLKHCTRMVLTWEDAYYNNSDCSQIKHSVNTLEKLHDGQISCDRLGSAVAKMSYQVFSLGEGIVGQVAVTGKHQWIFADNHATTPCSSFESTNGWQSQFSAGIRTVVVVAVTHGVVQLGSLYKATEDMKLVDQIRDLFLAIQDAHIDMTNQTHYVESSESLPSLSSNSLTSGLIPNNSSTFGKAVVSERQNGWLPGFSNVGELSENSANVLPNYSAMAVEVVKNQDFLRQSVLGIDKSNCIREGRSNTIICLEHQNHAQIMLEDHEKTGQVTSTPIDMGVCPVTNVTSLPNSVTDHADLSNTINLNEELGANVACFSSDFLDPSLYNGSMLNIVDIYQNGLLHVPETSSMKFQEELEMVGFGTNVGMNSPKSSFMFSAASELHEALGPAFLKKNSCTSWGDEKIVDKIMTELQEGTNGSQLTFDSGPHDLLEAVVANVYHTDDAKSERSFCKPVQSPLAAKKFPEPSSYSKQTVESSAYSINKGSLVQGKIRHCLSSSDISGVMSSNGVSSTCLSTCSEQFERSSEPTKNSKKRARPGESGRPRPRDRQLIQDRIKELRELVPNGAKCSIDSLLERTVKHMLFLQSVTQHSEKLNKFSNSKGYKEAGMSELSNSEHGSSWAVEVGSHLKVCSIMVENLNKNGQMLVEMLCEECSHFLEIAEAIRSLGLTILKGITEARGEKTWICFVVEGQNNRNIHRMDILWSLVQILQPKTSN